MRLLFLSILATLTLYGSVKEKLFELYKSENYKEACSYGFKYFDRFNKDEKFVSLYGFACLNVDYIDRLSVPITILRHSKESRSNAAYFSAIFLQKKMLYHALLDNYEISSLNLPTTDYVLSKVFDLYTKLEKNEQKNSYIFEDETNSRIKYKLYILKDGKIRKMVIEEYDDSKIVKKHIYW